MTFEIEVWDKRPEMREHKLLLQQGNIPETWTTRDILTRFGVAEHLVVYRYVFGGPRTEIQHGRQ